MDASGGMPIALLLKPLRQVRRPEAIRANTATTCLGLETGAELASATGWGQEHSRLGPPPSLPQSGRKGLLTSMSCLFRGAIVYRTYGAHKTLYTSLFLLRKFGPTYHYMSPVMVGVATLFPLPRRQV